MFLLESYTYKKKDLFRMALGAGIPLRQNICDKREIRIQIWIYKASCDENPFEIWGTSMTRMHTHKHTNPHTHAKAEWHKRNLAGI